MIRISSNNEQLLDLLTPQSMRLVLVERTTFGDDNRPRFSRRLPAQFTMKSQIRSVAKWWKYSSSGPTPSERRFAGELLVPEDLPPACQILHYGHEVTCPSLVAPPLNLTASLVRIGLRVTQRSRVHTNNTGQECISYRTDQHCHRFLARGSTTVLYSTRVRR